MLIMSFNSETSVIHELIPQLIIYNAFDSYMAQMQAVSFLFSVMLGF